ncbi:MAG: AbrB/MazE/SpoVT family DNA-binding domain-containing protein [Deltaproteobacteria bacterium]|nr:AbrB/MazE/SpoVT family DNA-binding domain-containing protein [Deltaproteobacteria bacterium]
MPAVSSKYQVVIPKEVRHNLQIKPGMQVSVMAKGGIAYIVPNRPLKDLVGMAKGLEDSKKIRDKKDRF